VTSIEIFSIKPLICKDCILHYLYFYFYLPLCGVEIPINDSYRSFHGGKDLLPQTSENAECKTASGLCFEAGDARSSEQAVLAAIHTLFMR